MADRTDNLTSGNLLGIPETRLPDDFVDVQVAEELEDGDPREVASRHLDSPLAWATLAQDALSDGDAIAAYAFARTGYHRGLDALRRAGWRGQGPIPAAHAPNRGFLRALAMLGETSRRLGDEAEADRVTDFLREADPTLLG
ncbi:DUF3151 domain-containing protein [Brachybacterium saurashtrense]|uniref:DUF3151 domain-containing protein n=1 Tax=Brachybacterium saurashtrense TaxID=556288 RepID=A0A345YKL0_9MICO|nr:DUF3151 domain-containing protein [Brachybacterium saurashtrense]AXK44462.1 DUF3151 domain-containing protein [Brachybacterium saurashtrense]RRR23074.1 DUF3151 domain-containing protein [Brachybacterium saurashtrense]